MAQTLQGLLQKIKKDAINYLNEPRQVSKLIDPGRQKAAREILTPTTQAIGNYARSVGSAFIQAPVLAATGGRVNIPILKENELAKFSGSSLPQRIMNTSKVVLPQTFQAGVTAVGLSNPTNLAKTALGAGALSYGLAKLTGADAGQATRRGIASAPFIAGGVKLASMTPFASLKPFANASLGKKMALGSLYNVIEGQGFVNPALGRKTIKDIDLKSKNFLKANKDILNDLIFDATFGAIRPATQNNKRVVEVANKLNSPQFKQLRNTLGQFTNDPQRFMRMSGGGVIDTSRPTEFIDQGDKLVRVYSDTKLPVFDDSQTNSIGLSTKQVGVIDKAMRDKTIGSIQQGKQLPALTDYENAMNKGDFSKADYISKMFPEDARFQVHKRFMPQPSVADIKVGDKGPLDLRQPVDPNAMVKAENLNQKMADNFKTMDTYQQAPFTPRSNTPSLGLSTQPVKPSPEVTAIEKALKAGKITNEQAQKQIRSFSQRASQDQRLSEFQRQAILDNPESFYDRVTNNEAKAFIQKNIIKKGEDYALKVATDKNDPNANATAMELIEGYLKKNETNKATQLIQQVSPRFTEQGRSIQILSQYGKLKPVGALRFAQTTLDEANKNIPKLKQIKLTTEHTKKITELANAIPKDKEGTREYLVATAKLMDYIASLVPPSLGQKISTIQTMGQLLNPKTLIRNTVGNVGFAGLENVSQTVGTGLDKIVSQFTGKRTITLPSPTTQLRGAKQGFKLGLEDAVKGIDTSGGIVTQFDLPHRTFRTGPLGGLEKILNIGLRATDRAAFTAAKNDSLRSQMKLAGVTQPTDEMMATAIADGKYRTFQDNSKLAEIFVGTKRVLNKVGTPDGKFGLGDFLLKYPKTPANLLARGIDYSPAGLAKGVYQLVRPLMAGTESLQREGVMNISRGLVGTGIVSLGYILAKNGIVTAMRNKDRDISEAQRQQGEGPFKINIDALKRFYFSNFDPNSAKPQAGDTLVSYDWFQPQSIQFSMGANMGMQGNSKEVDATEAINAALESLIQQPLVRGVSEFVTNLADPRTGGVAKAGRNLLTNTSSSFIPTLFNQVGQLFDNVSRSTYDPKMVQEAINKVKQRLPGLRTSLEPQISTLGQSYEQYQDGGNSIFNVFFNPAFVTKYKDDPVLNEVLDLYRATDETSQAPRLVQRKVKINGENKVLSAKEVTAYQTYVGQKTDVLFNEIINDPAYSTLSDEDKASYLAKQLTDINKAAKVELFGDSTDKLDAGTKAIISGSKTTRIPTDTGIKQVNLDFVPKEPNYTGNEEIDKKLTSKFNSSITKQKNEVISAFEQGYMDQSMAEDRLKILDDLYKPKSSTTKTKKAKKGRKTSIKISSGSRLRSIRITSNKIKLPKITKSKQKTIKIAKTKSVPTRSRDIFASIVKQPKERKVKIIKPTIRRTSIFA